MSWVSKGEPRSCAANPPITTNPTRCLTRTSSASSGSNRTRPAGTSRHLHHVAVVLGRDPSALGRSELEQSLCQCPIHAPARAPHRLETLAGGGQEPVERVDAGDHRAG